MMHGRPLGTEAIGLRGSIAERSWSRRVHHFGLAPWGLVALLFGGAGGVALPPTTAHAQAVDRNAEARVFFERGNRLLQRAMQRRGRRRTALLEEALREYVSALRIVRSRNALFNAAVTLELLGRHEEAFGYWTEYLHVPGLSETERAEAEKRRDALRAKVAVMAVEGEPAGAEVRVDRLDLAPVGTLPIEVAVRPGEHVVFVSKPGFERAERHASVRRGERVVVRVALRPRPVRLVVEVEGEGALTIDGEPAEAGRPIALPPGEHHVRFVPRTGVPVERTVALTPGESVRRLRIEPERIGSAALRIEADAAAAVYVDDERLGEGRSLRLELPAGRHRLRLLSPDGRSWEGSVLLRPGMERTMRAHGLAPPGPGAAFWVAGGIAGAALLAGTTVGILARLRRDAFDEQVATCESNTTSDGECWNEAGDLADQVDRLNLVADTLFGVAVLGGAVALWRYVAATSEEHPVQVAAMPMHGGGVAFALRWGGGTP